MSERRNPSVNEVVDTIIAYAKDQTIGPLRGAGRWVLWGAIGAVLLGSGALLVLLGALRAIQTEWNGVGDNWSWSWVPYLIVLVLAIALLVVTLTRINRDHLARTDREDDHGHRYRHQHLERRPSGDAPRIPRRPSWRDRRSSTDPRHSWRRSWRGVGCRRIPARTSGGSSTDHLRRDSTGLTGAVALPSPRTLARTAVRRGVVRAEHGWRFLGWTVVIGRFVGRAVRRRPEKVTVQRLRRGQGLDVRTSRRRPA